MKLTLAEMKEIAIKAGLVKPDDWFDKMVADMPVQIVESKYSKADDPDIQP